MDFHTDEDSFGAPYDRAPQEARQAFIDAGRTVEGANARAEEAERAIGDLLLFREQLAGLIRDKGFSRLPRLRGAWLRRIEHYRHLSVGVWRGLFVVAADGSAAVAVIFSRAPHDYMDRLDELRIKHANKLEAAADEDKSDAGGRR